jgi:dTDP-4-dehydrorhamnose 3,5-epimerase
MKLTETRLSGAFVVEVAPVRDARGLFARTFDRDVFAAHGLASEVVQASVSYNARVGTLRGLHYQTNPHEEEKLVRCVRGAIHDVIVDLRRASPTYGEWIAIELDDESRRALYIPKGFAHGFQTLTPDAEVLYQMSTPYVPASARGVRWDDPAFGVAWPQADAGRTISERDASYPDFRP